MKKLLLTQILFFPIFLLLDAQVLINQVWTSSAGQPDDINFPLSQWDEMDWSSSVLTSNDDLIIVGNTLQSAGNTDILVTKQNSQGQILWEQTFAGIAASYDYGLAVALDNNENVLVAGVVTTSNQTTDIALLKYSANGTLLWSTITDGGNNLHDIPTALTYDSNGNIYVVGGTLNLSTQSDWLISKYNNSGTLLWTTTYNYANLHELPVAIYASGNNIVVSGFSNSTSSSWDFAKIVFSGIDGNMLSEDRETIPDLSISDAVAIASDDNNNIYIAGTSTGSSDDNKNIQLVKINSGFEIEWIRNVDAEGLEDKAKSIDIDNDGNIFVAGNSKKGNGGTQITLAKFTPAGDLKFKRDYLAPSTFEVAEVSKIKISDEGDIYVTGSVDRNGNKDFVTLMYDSEGRLLFEKFFSGDGEAKDIAKNIDISSGGKILVTGKSEGLETKYTTVKYETYKRSDEVVFVNNSPHHKAKEFIVKFIPSFVDTNFVNDRTKRYGTIYDILEFSAAKKISDRIDLRKSQFAKVYPRLTTSHTQSLTRLGETIPIPEFWSVFLVVLDAGQNVDDLITQFEGMPEYVVYAHPNHVYQYHTIPNDALFATGDQSSLFPSADFPNANINVEPAWDIETGQNYVRVGVFDAPILWSHEDFGDGTLEGSQIADGFNFVNQTGIADNTNPANSHGTATGGIIGALRDNGIGIAGIAGGGLDANGNFNDGIALHSMAIGVLAPDIAAAAQGIVEGAMDANAEPAGFAENIQNHSWGGPDNNTLRDAVKFAWRNQCVFVASRGNAGTPNLLFPSCYEDVQVLNIGGSGDDGEYFNGNNGFAWAAAAGLTVNGSSWAGDLDIIAPAVTENVMSLINPNFPWMAFDANGNNVYPAPVGAASNYQVFSGTSAAAPHVSGVAALMCSLHNVNKGQPNNLAPEDVEFILQRYATDIVNDDPTQGPIYPVGYDDENGWGRLNAFEAVRRVEGPQWQVFHSGEPDNIEEVLIEEVPFGVGGLIWRKYLVTHTYQDVFSSTTQIIDFWARLSSTNGGESLDAPLLVGNKYWAAYNFSINGNVASVTAYTYRYELLNGTGVLQQFPEQEIQTAYSLHLFDPQATSVEELNKLGTVSIFPNPSIGKFNLIYKLNDAKATSIQLIDITGNLIFEATASNEKTGEISLDLSGWSSGMYICRLLTDKGVISKKVVKQ